MQRQAPSLSRILVMVGFSLSVFGLLLFLWLSFGGSVPLRPEGYRIEAAFPDSANLVQEADVRMSGINVGKVKSLDFQEEPARAVATLELDARYAPIPEDTRAILRQKTLLGETYVELTPGSRGGPKLDDGGRLPDARVASTVELDEIFEVFDPPTRRAFKRWVTELAKSTRGGGGRDLNEAFGQLSGFAEAGADVLTVLDRRRDALERFVRNTGVVFGALNEQDGALRALVTDSNRLFETTASRDEALAQTIEVFPAFLDESRATLARLERFAVDTGPLVRNLRPVARQLTPTLADIARLSPDLENLFSDIDTLNALAPRTLPDGQRFLAGAAPVLEALHPFLQELNPVISFANFNSAQLADFITVGGATLQAEQPGGGHVLRQIALINDKSLALQQTRPADERANAYLEPNAWLRARALGVLESFDCSHVGGERPDPEEGLPPCFVKPGSLFDGGRYPTVGRGESPLRQPPQENEGTEPATP